MTDEQIEELIMREITKRGVTFYDMISLSSHNVDPNPEDQTQPGNRRARRNRFKGLLGCDRMEELLSLEEYNPYRSLPPLKVPIQELFRFWWNRCVEQELIVEEILEDIYSYFLKRIDEQRKKWSRILYGFDTGDPSLYDLVLHIHRITVEDAADIVCHTVGLKHFQTTPESQKEMNDLVLAAEVKAALINLKPDIEISAKNGKVTVNTKAHESQEVKLIEEMKEIAKTVPGVKEVLVHVHPVLPYGE